ncbi:MAG: hypothetical protein J5674_01460 [Candidatus Methanomethylophilaceae archaeon]|nr:hypothetical protein [Candidatus Methanomethylophilaceae archaeon]
MTLTDVGVREFYDKYIDMDSAARNSKVQIIVRKKTPKEKVSGTNGRYYIGYVYDGEPMVDFHFPYRTDAALFLCCLIKRKGKDGDKDFDFAAMEDLFIGAFKYLYGDVHPAATSAFGQLFDTVGESKIIAQGNLKDHLNNIRKEIDAHLLRKENTAVFHVRKGDHLHILKERITLPDNIEEAVLRLASADAEIPKA